MLTTRRLHLVPMTLQLAEAERAGATTLAQGGDRRSSRLMWESILQSAEVDWLRQQAEHRLLQLRALDQIDSLQRIVDRFLASPGHPPLDWAGLARARMLPGRPLDPSGTPYVIQDGKVTIPASQVGEGELKHYVSDVNGVPVRFFLYRKPDHKVAALFDACEICGPVGFYKSGNAVICKNCAAPINPQSVGQPGGCNPIPLKATITDETVVITQAQLAEGAAVFSTAGK